MEDCNYKLKSAQQLLSQGEYEEGIKLLYELGDHPIALRLLGLCFYRGLGVEIERNKALEYFVMAYENGAKDWGFYESIHELVGENLREFKKKRCDFKEEIEPINKKLKYNLDYIARTAKTSFPYDESTQLLISIEYTLACNKCCDIIKVFLAHQGGHSELSPRLLFLEGMKLGLIELEFLKDVIPCYDKIVDESDFPVTNDVSFTYSIMAMRSFMERVDEVINNKSDAEILKEIFEKNATKDK